MKEIVHAVVTIQGGERGLSTLEKGEVSGAVHDALAESIDLQRKYGRTGYTIHVELVEE